MGLHAELRPARLRVLAHAPVQRLDDHLFSLAARIEIHIPTAVIADQAGTVVREEPAEELAAELVLNVDTSPGSAQRWFIRAWQFGDDATLRRTRSDAGAAIEPLRMAS